MLICARPTQQRTVASFWVGVLENAHDFAHFNIFPRFSLISYEDIFVSLYLFLIFKRISMETSLLEDAVALRHGHQRRNPRGVSGGHGGGENAALQYRVFE